MYSDEAARTKLINVMYHFTRKLDIHYVCPYVDKSKSADYYAFNSLLSRAISDKLREIMDYLNSFDKIIIYYDNGQHELNRILTSVFSILFNNVEFRKVQPSDYKLFQVADLICTWELLAMKAKNGLFYDTFFGAEGSLGAVIAVASVSAVLILMAGRKNSEQETV